MNKSIKLPFGISITLTVKKHAALWFKLSPYYLKDEYERNGRKYYYKLASIDLTVFKRHIFMAISRMSVAEIK